MPLVSDSDLVRIKLDGDEWVDIKRLLSFQDMDMLQESIAKVRLKNIPAGRDLAVSDLEDIEIHSGRVLMLQLAIKAWNILDAEGNPAELTRENIADLPMHYGEKICAEIDRLNSVKKV